MRTKNEEKNCLCEYGIETYLIQSNEMACFECGKLFGEGDSFVVTMIPHDEGTVESGPSPPKLEILCSNCYKEFKEIAMAQGGITEDEWEGL